MAKKKGEWELVGRCGVDSGQLMIIDPCYLSDWVDNDCDDKVGKSSMSYAGACKATLSEDMYGQLHNKIGIDLAVAFSSGYGDGLYPVYARKNEDGRVVEVKVVME